MLTCVLLKIRSRDETRCGILKRGTDRFLTEALLYEGLPLINM
jgi:hypothetical protein